MSRLKNIFICAGIFVFIAFGAKTAAADQANVALFTSWTFVKSAIQNYFKAVANYHQISIPDQMWSIDQINWHIQGIKFSSNAVLSGGVLTDSTYSVNSNHLGIKVNVNDVWVNQTIHETIDGVVFIVHFKANCGPISLTQTNARASVTINYKFLPQSVQANASSLKLDWPANSWVIAPISCQGPKGFSTTLTQALQQQLNNPRVVQNFMHQKIDAALANELNTINSKFNVPIPIQILKNSLSITMKLAQFKTLSTGILISSIVSWPGLPPTYSGPPLPIQDIDFNRFNEPVIISEKQDWAKLLQAEFARLPIPSTFNLNKISLFNSFRTSEVEEYLIWPNLVNFQPNSPFTLLIDHPLLGAFRWKKNVNFQLSAVDNGWLKAFRDGQYWHYLDLNALAKFNFAPQINNGRLNAKFTVHDGQLNYQFNQEYADRYGHFNHFINNLYLVYTAEKWGAPYDISYRLPTLRLSFFGSAEFDGLKSESPNLITIPLKINPP